MYMYRLMKQSRNILIIFFLPQLHLNVKLPVSLIKGVVILFSRFFTNLFQSFSL